MVQEVQLEIVGPPPLQVVLDVVTSMVKEAVGALLCGAPSWNEQDIVSRFDVG